MHRRFGKLALLGAALMVAGPLTVAAQASSATSIAHSQVHATADFDIEYACYNNGGTIRMTGPIHVTDTSAGVGFGATYNNGTNPTFQNGTRTVSYDISTDTQINWPKRMQEQVGGNPYIWFVLDDGAYLIGRCVVQSNKGAYQRAAARGIDTVLDLVRTISLSATKCTGQRSELGVGIDDTLTGFDGDIVLTNQLSEDSVHSAIVAGASIHIGLAPGGLTYFNKGGGWKQEGVGGNPTVYLNSMSGGPDLSAGTIAPDSGATAEMPWVSLGRCSDLRKSGR